MDDRATRNKGTHGPNSSHVFVTQQIINARPNGQAKGTCTRYDEQNKDKQYKLGYVILIRSAVHMQSTDASKQ